MDRAEGGPSPRDATHQVGSLDGSRHAALDDQTPRSKACEMQVGRFWMGTVSLSPKKDEFLSSEEPLPTPGRALFGLAHVPGHRSTQDVVISPAGLNKAWGISADHIPTSDLQRSRSLLIHLPAERKFSFAWFSSPHFPSNNKVRRLP